MSVQSEFLGFHYALDGFPPEVGRYYAVFRFLIDGIFYTHPVKCVGAPPEEDESEIPWLIFARMRAEREALMYYKFVKRVREISA